MVLLGCQIKLGVIIQLGLSQPHLHQLCRISSALANKTAYDAL